MPIIIVPVLVTNAGATTYAYAGLIATVLGLAGLAVRGVHRMRTGQWRGAGDRLFRWCDRMADRGFATFMLAVFPMCLAIAAGISDEAVFGRR